MTPFVGVCVTIAQGRQWGWKSEDPLRTTELTECQSGRRQPPWSLLFRPVFSRNPCLPMLGLTGPPECEPNCYHMHLCSLLPPDWLFSLSGLFENHMLSSSPSSPALPHLRPPSHQSQSVQRGPPTRESLHHIAAGGRHCNLEGKAGLHQPCRCCRGSRCLLRPP